MRRFLAVMLAATAFAVVVPTLGASAGPPSEDQLEVGLFSDTEPLVFVAYANVGETCDSVAVVEVRANGNPVVPLSVVPDDTEPNVVYIVLPSDTPPGVLAVDVECLVGEQPIDASGSEEWAALAVTKVIDGSAPEGTQFTVAVECFAERQRSAEFALPQGIDELVVYELDYTASGETHYVYFDNQNECTITEPVNGGAIATTITPDLVVIDDPGLFPVTVTNTFPVAVEPTFTG